VVSAHTASLRLGLDRLLSMVPLRGSKPPSKAIPVNPSPDNPPTSRSTRRASHSKEPKSKTELLRSIRIWLSLFIAGLVLSGITAFPLEQETAWLADFAGRYSVLPSDITLWLDRVHTALHANSSFGVFGAIPLLICLNRVKRLEQFEQIVLTLNPADFPNDPPIAFH
jgi:hypothetical protein